MLIVIFFIDGNLVVVMILWIFFVIVNVCFFEIIGVSKIINFFFLYLVIKFVFCRDFEISVVSFCSILLFVLWLKVLLIFLKKLILIIKMLYVCDVCFICLNVVDICSNLNSMIFFVIVNFFVFWWIFLF